MDGYSSSISGSASDGYVITNTLQVGNLVLNKTVSADSSVDTSGMTFTFYVSGFDTDVQSITDRNENKYTVTDGIAAVTVSADGSVTLVNVPVGTYTIYETDGTAVTANGYEWTVSGENGEQVTVTDGSTVEISITNILKTTTTSEEETGSTENTDSAETTETESTENVEATETEDYTSEETTTTEESVSTNPIEVASAQTGDTMNVTPYTIIMLAAAAVILSLVIYSRRKNAE